jgi:hypothetical protein
MKLMELDIKFNNKCNLASYFLKSICITLIYVILLTYLIFLASKLEVPILNTKLLILQAKIVTNTI